VFVQAAEAKFQGPVGKHAVVPAAVEAHENAPVPEQATHAPEIATYPTLHVTHVVPLH
jgi:hypothetical protein